MSERLVGSSRRDPESPRPPSAFNTMIVTSGLLLLAVATLVRVPAAGPFGGLAVRLLCLVLLVALLAWYSYRRHVRPQKGSHHRTEIWSLPDQQVDILRRSAGRRS